MAEKKHNFGKEGYHIINFWVTNELRERFHKTCKKCYIGYADILSRLIIDFCDGKIYDLPSWEPIDKSKMVYYKDENGEWIYITPQDFIERIDKKKNGRDIVDPAKEAISDISKPNKIRST